MEFQGKTLEEAVERALVELGRQPGEIEYEVIEDSRKGFLGLGARLVKIRVLSAGGASPYRSREESADVDGEPEGVSSPARMGKPRTAPLKTPPVSRGAGGPQRDQSRRDAWNRGPGGGSRGQGQTSQQRPRRDGGGPGTGVGQKRRAGSENTGSQDDDSRGNRREEPTFGSRHDDSIGNRRDTRGQRQRKDEKAGARTGRAVRGPRTQGDERSSAPSISPIEAARQLRLPDNATYSKQEAVRTVAGPLLRAMNLDVRARLHDRDGVVILDLSGEDAPRLLENEGEALDALQHILSKILARDERFQARVVVDCEGFRVSHDQELIDRATKAAQEAVQTGEAVHFDQLNSYERRLVHMTLAEDARVRTYSVGEGAIKRLTVEPLDHPPPREA